jgi:hypothetical protein
LGRYQIRKNRPLRSESWRNSDLFYFEKILNKIFT